MKKKIISLAIFFCSIVVFAPNKTNAAGMEANMISPGYRNAIYATMTNPSVIKIRTKTKVGGGKIQASLKRNGSVIRSWQFDNTSSAGSAWIINLDVKGITFEYTRSGPFNKDDNPYKILLEFVYNNKKAAEIELELHKYPSAPAGVSEVRLDDSGNILINGKKTFISGAYLLNTKENYSYLESKGINAFVEQQSHLTGGYHSQNSTGLVHVSDTNVEATRTIIKNIRSKSNLLGYYLSDEPNLRKVNPAKLREVYDVAQDEDPYHPAITVLNFGTVYGWIPSFTGTQDMIGGDVYPLWKGTAGSIHKTDISTVTTYFKLLRSISAPQTSFEHYDTSAYGIPQIFTMDISDQYGILDHRLPNKTELKNMTYQYLACGSKMLFPYTYDLRWTTKDIWEYYTGIMKSEVKGIEPAIFAPEKDGTVSIVKNNKVSVSGFSDNELTWSYRETSDKEYLFLVNTTNKWDYGSSDLSKDKELNLTLNFKQPGNSTLNALVKDSGKPASYALNSNNFVSLKLSGVNDTSTGVLVLERSKTAQGQPIRSDCSTRGKDIIADGSFNIADIHELEKRYYSISAGTKTDVNSDGSFNYSDVRYLVDCYLCKLDWKSCLY